MLTTRFSQALALSVQAHAGQFRKGTQVPYVAHPLGVASLALDFGADEDQAIAALLHDVLEDGGPHYEEPIRQQFGHWVLALVQGCTDGVADANGRKADWGERKRAYLSHLEAASDDVLLVSGSDKLHNARAILSDLQALGPAVFDRFAAGREGTLWYYRSLAGVFARRGSPVAGSLEAVVGQIEVLAVVESPPMNLNQAAQRTRSFSKYFLIRSS